MPNYLNYIPGVLAIACFVIIIICFGLHYRSVLTRRAYAEMFIKHYQESGNVRTTLSSIISAWHGSRSALKGIMSAEGYLCTSALADYRTAFDLIESRISDDRIRRIHEACLFEEKRKRMHLISMKGEGK